MTEATFDKIRPEDHAVLVSIRDGDADVRSINAEKALTRRQINYAFTKLADLGLITVETPDGWREEVIDGQKRKFRAPKHAALTKIGVQYFEWSDQQDDLQRFQNMSRDELVQAVRKLEADVERLETTFAVFKKQVLTKLDDSE